MKRGTAVMRGLIFGCALFLGGCAAETVPVTGHDAANAEVEPLDVDGGYGTYLAAHAARLRDDIDGAARNLERTLAIDPGNLDVQRLTLIYSAADGRTETAVAAAEAIVEARPEDMLSGYVLATERARAGDWAGAEARLAAIPDANLNALLGPLLRAWVAVGRGDVDEGLRRLQPLTARKPFLPIYNFHSALILDYARRDAEARAAYERTLDGEGGRSIHAIQAAGRFFNRTGSPARTDELVDAFAAERGDAPMTEALTRTLIDRRAAEPVVTSPLEGLAEAYLSIGTSLANSEAWEITLSLAQLALYADPGLDLARVLVGDLFETHDDYARANDSYAAVSPESDVSYSVKVRMAKNLERLDRHDAAAAELTELAQRFPDRPEPLIELGDLYRGDSRFEEAVKAYDAAMARIGTIEQRHWVLFYTRGIALERSKQWKRAEADFLQALELEPDQPLVLNYLGYSWLDQGMHADRAQEMIEKAVEQRPRDGYIIDSLGWAHYLRGNYQQAVAHLEQAVVLVADDPTINDHLGDAYWRVGRTFEARYQWQRALGLKPDEQQAKALRDKLKDGLPAAKP
ncbi:TPR repeat protein [uncultured Alphaproteobacteria bacterium]|uniref:TPR repeat protein n=1 Tax=uncultured Alphaproteobacteria bacterium TaxID=91750 RepID=A0A212JUP2_9PROT|nr:TPR repeat protein [uncultured Alphaproteobacteria bacterium]